MDTFAFGNIVLLRFPFSDGVSFKRRPALVLKDFGDGDMLVCRITSKLYRTPFDIYVTQWAKFGLKLPSTIRVHKMATLECSMAEAVMGNIDNATTTKVKAIFASIVDE